jgi:acetyl esterase/lipase
MPLLDSTSRIVFCTLYYLFICGVWLGDKIFRLWPKPHLSVRARAVIAILRLRKICAIRSLTCIRMSMLGGLDRHLPITSKTVITRIKCAHVSCVIISPYGVHSSSDIMVYIHGGGFVSGNFQGYAAFCSYIVSVTGIPLCFPEYSLCPEVKITDIVDEIVCVVNSHIQCDMHVVLVGDSAGGNLAMLTSQRICPEPAIVGVVLISPVTTLNITNGTLGPDSTDPMISAKLVRWCFDVALQDQNPLDPNVSCVYGDLRNAPDIYCIMGENEVFAPSIKKFTSMVYKCGGSCDTYCVNDLFHCFPSYLGLFPEAMEGSDMVVSFINRAFSGATLKV